jgi:hypothetical protein
VDQHFLTGASLEVVGLKDDLHLLGYELEVLIVMKK